MGEPYENYVQYFIPEWEHLISISNLMKEAEIPVTFSKDKENVGHEYNYLILNTKHRQGNWNNAQLRIQCIVVDNNFMDQLKVLEAVSVDAQIEFLLNPM